MTFRPKKRPKVRTKESSVVRCQGHLAHVRQLFCIVPGCKREPVEAMHIEAPMNASKGMKAADDRVVPGCAWHHRLANNSYHNIGRDRFEKAHGVNFEQAIAATNKASPALKRYRAKQLMAGVR